MKYDGCSITTGFLTGNLGEMSYAWEQYRDGMKRRLENEYPGAEVEVKVQHAEGVLPIPLHTFVYIEGGTREEEEKVKEDVDWVVDNFGDLEDWYSPNSEMLHAYLAQTLYDGQAVIGTVVNYYAGQNVEYHTVMLDDIPKMEGICGWEDVWDIPQEELESLMARCLDEADLSGAGEGYTWKALQIDESLWIYPSMGW